MYIYDLFNSESKLNHSPQRHTNKTKNYNKIIWEQILAQRGNEDIASTGAARESYIKEVPHTTTTK